MATRGTGFINPQTRAAANAGAGQALADRLNSFLEQGRTNFNNALSARQAQFGSDVSAGTAVFDSNGLTAEEAERRASTSTYKGPESLGEQDGWQQVLAQGQRAERDANLGADYNGRQALLQQMYGNSGTPYTPAMSRFDSFLAGANGGQARFDAAKGQSGGLLRQANAADKDSRAQSSAARTASQNVAQRYRAVAPTIRGREQAAANPYVPRPTETGAERRQDERRPRRPRYDIP